MSFAEMFDAVDLFAGVGWSEGMRSLGLRDFGLELDDAACRTRYAAGHATWQVDVATVNPSMFKGVRGLIASPPCQDLSQMGKRAGRTGETGHLIDVVPAWVNAMRPRWVAAEQVPDALPVWQEHAELYRRLGYSTWCGVLNAADYGVPQARHRAFLVASLDAVAHPPEPTHSESPAPSFFGELEPWATAQDAVGWTELVDTRCDQRPDGTTQTFDPTSRPTTTITGKSLGQWLVGGRPVDTADALELQSFRRDLPIQGTRAQVGQQVGNAVPPALAAAVIGALT